MSGSPPRYYSLAVRELASFNQSMLPVRTTHNSMGVDHGGDAGDKSPEFGVGGR